MRTTAILTGAGSGSRLGANVPKALVPINGVPMVRIAAENLFASGVVDDAIVTVPDGYVAEFAAALDGIKQPITLVIGGETRQQSIANALNQLHPDCGKVLVHDAARPFAPAALIESVAQKVNDDAKAVIPALPVTDTIKVVRPLESQQVVATVDRTTLRAVQTPQGFDRATLAQAYEAAITQNLEATDDAGLAEAIGVAVFVIPGDPAAMKITTQSDLKIATLLYSPSGTE